MDGAAMRTNRYREIVKRALGYIKCGADVTEAMERAERELSKEESESPPRRLRVQK